MTDLVRRALLGDRQAQEECTRREIVIPCVHGNEGTVFEAEIDGVKAYRVVTRACCCMQGPVYSTYKSKAIADWNRRPAPPIGRCGECGAYTSEGPGLGYCSDGTGKTDDGYCDCFYPKGDEDDG